LFNPSSSLPSDRVRLSFLLLSPFNFEDFPSFHLWFNVPSVPHTRRGHRLHLLSRKLSVLPYFPPLLPPDPPPPHILLPRSTECFRARPAVICRTNLLSHHRLRDCGFKLLFGLPSLLVLFSYPSPQSGKVVSIRSGPIYRSGLRSDASAPSTFLSRTPSSHLSPSK